MHIHSCVYLQETSGSRHAPFTHRTSRASHHCSTPVPRVTLGGPEVPQGRELPDLKGLATYVEPWHVFLSSLPREKAIFALEHKAILGRERFPSWKEANDSRGNMN